MQGLRKTMEDAMDCELCFGGLEHHFMMVCDGHGGDFVALKVGEMMKKHIVDRKSIDYDGTENERRHSYSDTLKQSFLEVDNRLLETDLIKADEDFSGSTVNVAIITENEVYCANAGDTRCVISVGMKAFDLSTDHKPSLPSEKERIIAAGARVARGRVNGLHGVARSLGDFSYKEAPLEPGDNSTAVGKIAAPENQVVTCMPEIVVYPRTESDEFVLICCDGVWDVMTSQDAVTFMHAKLAKSEAKDLEEALEMLLDKCLELGSKDNMTAVCIALPGFCRIYNYFRPPTAGCSAVCGLS